MGKALALRRLTPFDRAVSDDRAYSAQAKRAFDLVVSALLLAVLSPLLGAIALWVAAADRGPIFFRQQRLGRFGTPIWVLKFRTLRVACCDASGRHGTAWHDPRVTAPGRFLRRTGLDELPQLLNVLAGSMSLVGPRPHTPAMAVQGALYEHLIPGYRTRLAVRPGLTGLAQIRGWSGPVTDRAHAEARIASDLEYIDRACLRLDLRILAATAFLLLRRLAGMA